MATNKTFLEVAKMLEQIPGHEHKAAWLREFIEQDEREQQQPAKAEQ